MAKKSIELKNTRHKFIKQNLMTLSDRAGAYDVMRCEHCRLEGKRRQINAVEVDGRTSDKHLEDCPKVPVSSEPIPQRVKITNFQGYSKNFVHLIEGSEHDVVETPSDYKSKFPNSSQTVWVNGVFEPVRLLPGEFEVIK
jgi:hypothetical protein